MPVSVEKHCRRKFSVSSTSMPEGGWGRVGRAEVVLEEGWVRWERGLRRVEMAWTLGGC